MQTTDSAPATRADLSLTFHRYLTLTTFRRTGEAVPTVVWFVAHAGKLYVRTARSSGKVKRIRHTDRVLVAPASVLGHQRGLTVVGHARVLPQLEATAFETLIDAKYGFQSRAFNLFGDLRDGLDTAIMEITLDPGPGTEALLLEAMPEPQRAREFAIAASLVTAGALGIGSTLLVLRRLWRARR